MMERSITIKIENQTEVELLKTAEHLLHGKWTDDIPPTKSIEPGGEGLVKAQKQTGAPFGTTGDCEYTLIDFNQTTLKITWNKPYTGDPEVTAAAAPPYVAHVKPDLARVTSGHYEAAVTVSGQVDPKKNVPHWMTQNWTTLRELTLNQVCLPGSHDSGTFTATYETRYGSQR